MYNENNKTKPLFIPLKKEHYEAFKSGKKNTEYRLYGPRWNKWTCRVGRAVVISKGYGKRDRMKGVIESFDAYYYRSIEFRFTKDERETLEKMMPSVDYCIACIKIRNLQPVAS